MNKKLVEYAELIREWSIKRELHNKDSRKQILKLGEEAGELFSGIAKQKPEVVKDSIGDVFVVLVIYCQQKGIELDKILTKFNADFSLYNKNSADSTLYSLKLMQKIGMLAADTIHSVNNDTTLLQVTWVLEDLRTISQLENVGLIECVDYAYNEIKGREGETINGSFIKKSDLEESE